jgi:hypothetical protein
VGSLTPSTTYQFKVRAYDGAGNVSGYSNIFAATTNTAPTSSPTSTVLNPDVAKYGEKIDADRDYDRNIKSDVTTKLSDNNDSSDVEIREDGSNDKWVYVKVNKEAGDYSAIKIKVRYRWDEDDSYGNLLFYPYKSDGTNINTGSVVDYKISSPRDYWKWAEVDVTSAAHTMDGFGWIKFRIKPGQDGSRERADLTEVRIILETPGGTITEASTTTAFSTIPADTSGTDTVPPTDPANLTAVPYNSAQIDLAWTASTDTGGSTSTEGEAQTCALCHGSAVRAEVKTAVDNNNPNCSACHTIHGDITTAHTGPGLSNSPWNCDKCHTKIVSTEHSSTAILTNNARLDCNTCHKSTLAQVTGAINSTVNDNSNLKCEACHTGTSDGVEKMHSDITAPHLRSIFTVQGADSDCLNCHTNQAAEFSSAKEGYHAVNNLTPKTGGMGTYINGWTSTSSMTCQNCHGSDGSSAITAYPSILIKPFYATTSNLNSDHLCFWCHDWRTYGGGSKDLLNSSGFKGKDGKNLHNDGHHILKDANTTDSKKQVYCVSCHTWAPHGGKYRLLGVTKDGAPFQNYAKNIRIDRVTTYVKDNCATNCGGHPSS